VTKCVLTCRRHYPYLLCSPITKQIVLQDDHIPMYAESASDRDAILDVLWLNASERDELSRCVICFDQILRLLPNVPCQDCPPRCGSLGRRHSTCAVRTCVVVTLIFERGSSKAHPRVHSFVASYRSFTSLLRESHSITETSMSFSVM
jgi:hypothetical protein